MTYPTLPAYIIEWAQERERQEEVERQLPLYAPQPPDEEDDQC